MNRALLPLSVAVLACQLLSIADAARAAGPLFETLPLYPGGEGAVAFGVSRDGSTVVGQANLVPGPRPTMPGVSEGVMWRNGQITALGDLPGADDASVARAASADGSVIVGAGNYTTTVGDHITPADRQAVRWANGLITPLIGPVGLRPIEAHAVSADGSVIIGEALSPSSPPAADHLEAFRWSNGVATGLGRLSNTDYSRAFGVSADGSVVVGDSASSIAPGRSEAFRWVNGVMTGLGSTPGNTGSVATAVSADGRVVVGAAFGPAGFPAFRWENGVMASIGDLGSSAYAQAVSGDGQVIVGWAGLPGGASETVAFIWDAAHGMRNL